MRGSHGLGFRLRTGAASFVPHRLFGVRRRMTIGASFDNRVCKDAALALNASHPRECAPSGKTPLDARICSDDLFTELHATPALSDGGGASHFDRENSAHFHGRSFLVGTSVAPGVKPSTVSCDSHRQHPLELTTEVLGMRQGRSKLPDGDPCNRASAHRRTVICSPTSLRPTLLDGYLPAVCSVLCQLVLRLALATRHNFWRCEACNCSSVARTTFFNRMSHEASIFRSHQTEWAPPRHGGYPVGPAGSRYRPAPAGSAWKRSEAPNVLETQRFLSLQKLPVMWWIVGSLLERLKT